MVVEVGGLHEIRDHVLARRVAALLGHLTHPTGEFDKGVLPLLLQRGIHELKKAPDRVLGELAKAVFVVAGRRDARDAADHGIGNRVGEFAVQIDDTAAAVQRLRKAVDHLPHLILHTCHRARRERGGDELANPRVLGGRK